MTHKNEEGLSLKNPFELVTASKLSATAAVALWCDDKRLDRTNGKESCFINGHRGTGKSMLFRILQHDCQKLLYPHAQPTFLAIYFSVRDTECMTEELDLFQSDAQKNILSESHFSLLLLKQLFYLLQHNQELVPQPARSELIGLTDDCIRNAFQYAQDDTPSVKDISFEEFLEKATALVERERVRLVNYIELRLYDRSPFEGPLFLFDTLLGPIADYFDDRLHRCLYFLIDDGDDLPESHTVVLNSWIARRRKSAVFKVSTMFGYKTYETRSRSAIQHPHDFLQYDIATRYVSDAAENYVNLLRGISIKRLKGVGIETSPGKVDPEEYFPEDAEQQERLKKVEARLLNKYAEQYKGRTVRDYVYRHLTSEYMKELQHKHALSTFTYSGFKTLAILSSGLVRDFIICAQRMFDNASRHQTAPVRISASIQNEIVRQHADGIMEEVGNPEQKRARSTSKDDWKKLRRLVEGLGSIFKAKMLSNDSERRVFSFAIQDEPSEEVERLLDLAIAEGYLMKGFISRKEGTGRRILYVLTRRLAPIFSLDVSAYSGYLSLTDGRLKELISSGGLRTALEPHTGQMSFFELEGESSEAWMFISSEEAGF